VTQPVEKIAPPVYNQSITQLMMRQKRIAGAVNNTIVTCLKVT